MQTRSRANDTRDARRQRILQLLGRGPVKSQADLQQLLVAAGFPINQATLSRDLRDLGVVKGKDGYELPATPLLTPATVHSSLWHAARAFLRSATAAQNLVVLKTPAGGAQALALAFDHATQEGSVPAVGTIAGDDTVLVVCRDAARARALARRLSQLRDAYPVSPASSA